MKSAPDLRPAGPRPSAWLAPITAAALALALGGAYLATMPPSITWWFGGSDSGDLAAAAATLGLAHPPGYPTYVLLGRLATAVPGGDPAGRMNGLSVALACVTAVTVMITGLTLLGRRPADAGSWRGSVAAGLAAAGVGASSLVWSQAIIAEVYTLHAALTALVLLVWARRDAGPLIRGIAHGLALTNHLTAIFALTAALAAAASSSRRRPKVWEAGWFTVGQCAPLTVYALAPVFSARDPGSIWGRLDTPMRLLAHVTGRGYGYLLDPGNLSTSLRDLLALASLVVSDLPPWLLPAALLGVAGVGRANRRMVWLSVALVAQVVLFAAVYRAPDRAPYLLPVYVLVGVWAGPGLLTALGALARARPWAPAAATPALLALTVLWGARTAVQVDLRGDDSALVFARATLEALPQGATYRSARDDTTFALLYAQRVLGLRRDVQVVDVRASDVGATR